MAQAQDAFTSTNFYLLSKSSDVIAPAAAVETDMF